MASNSNKVKIDAILQAQLDAQALNKATNQMVNSMRRQIESLSSQVDVSKLVRANMPSEKAFKSYEAPLGRINGLVNDFDKSLAASNARVLAFGASVASVGAVEKAFSSLLNSTVEVQKSLKELQVISEASNSEIAEYGNRLFDVAKNTATSFRDAAKAALEFSRQGLEMNQIIQRTNDTMIMMRITGISLDEAINGLTATINAFSNEDLSSGEILNALSAIDLAAAASTDGIIKGMARSASAARSAGVSFRELASFIATLQETTGLQGGVLGNSAKSIFTRIIDPTKLSTLKDYNIKIESDNGDLLSTMDILKNMAQTIKGVDGGLKAFGDKSELVKFMKEMSGLYQIDKLTALMNDLGRSMEDLGPEKLQALDKALQQVGTNLYGANGLRKGIDVLTELDEKIRSTSSEAEKSNLQNLYSQVEKGVSRYDRNLLNANQATDEAYQKNELLNQTLDAQIEKLKTAGIELGSTFGNTAFLDDLTSGLITVNEIIEKITDGIKGEGSLAFLENIVQGIGSVLTGPGLVLAIATIGKGISYMAKQTKDSWVFFMDLNKASQRQIQYEQLLNNLYQSNAEIQKVISDKTLSRSVQAQKVVALLDAEVAKTQALAKNYAEIAATMTSMTTLNVSQANIGAYQKGKFTKNRASGDNAFVREQKAIRMGVGGARKDASPIILDNFPLNGVKQTVVANSDEVIVNTPQGYKILNRNQAKELFGDKNFASGSRNPFVKMKEKTTDYFETRNIEKDLINKIERISGVSKEAGQSVDKLTNAVSKDSVEREKSLTGLIKWSVAASFLNGALLDVSENSSSAAKTLAGFGKVIESIVTLKMAGAAFGFGTSYKDVKGSFGNAWGELGKGFGGARTVVEAGNRAQRRNFSGDFGGSAASAVFTVFKYFKSLGPILRGIVGAFSKMLPVVGWLITAWQIMPDSWTDGILKAIGLIDTPAEKAAKAINQMTEAAIKNAIDTKTGPTFEEAGKAGQKAFLEYRAQYAIQKDNLKDVKNANELFNKLLDDNIKGIDFSGIKGTFKDILDKNFANAISTGNSRFGKTPSGIILPGREYEQDFIESTRRSRFGPKTLAAPQNDIFDKNLLNDEEKSLYEGFEAQIEQFIKELTLGKFFDDKDRQKEYNRLLATDKDAAKKYIEDETSKISQDIMAPLQKAMDEFNSSDIAKNSLSKGYKEYISASKKFFDGITTDLSKSAKELGVSESTLKDVRKVAYTFSARILAIKNEFQKALNQIELIREIPTAEDLNLTRTNIYGSSSQKLQAQYAVTRQNQNRAREDSVMNMRKMAYDFLQKNATLPGMNTKGFENAQSMIATATSAEEIQNAFRELTKWAGENEKLTPEQTQKVNELFESLSKIDAKTAVAQLKTALNDSATALAEFSKYINGLKFREALSDVESELTAFSSRIRNLNSQTNIQDTVLSAISLINPNISPGIEAEKAQLSYESGIKQILLEQQKYFAETEKEIIQRISNVSSPQDRDDLLAIVEKIRGSEGGFSNIEQVSQLVEKVTIAEEESLREEQKTRLALAIQELRTAEMQYKAANIQLDAAEQNAQIAGIKNFSTDVKNAMKQMLPEAIRNLAPVQNLLYSKKNSGEDAYTRRIQEQLQELIKQSERVSNLTIPQNIGFNAGNNQRESMYSKSLEVDAQLIQKAYSNFENTMTQLDKALNLKVNQQLLGLSAKIKQLSDSITKFRLNLEKEDVDVESEILLLPDDIKEVVQGFRLLDKANKELAIGQMEVAQANLEHRRSLVESISQITDLTKRKSLYESFSNGASNKELGQQIARAMAEQDIMGLRSNDIFKSSVDNFGKFNDVFKTAVEDFERAILKYAGKDNNFPSSYSSGSSTQKLARERNKNVQYRGMGTVNAGQNTEIPSDDDLVPVKQDKIASKEQDVGKALEGFVEDIKETAEPMSNMNQTTKKAVDELTGLYNALSDSQEAENRGLQAQINYQKAVNESTKFLKRFEIAGNKAITAATALEKYQYQRQQNIGYEKVRDVAGYEGKTYKEAFEDVSKSGNLEDLKKIQESFNKRTEFKTFREGWSKSLAQMSDDAKRLEENMGKMIGTIKDGFVDAFSDAITGAKSFEDAMTDAIQSIANQIIKHGLNSLISNMFSGVAGIGAGGKNSASDISASQSGMGGGIWSWLTNLFADGGQVRGGSGVRDDVPALLTGGEYVINKKAVSTVGKDYLDFLNSGKISKFATGGFVKGRNSDRLYYDNGGYPIDTSKANNGGNNGFYSPGKYGYDSIVGRHNLKSFATQSFTSGQYDVIKQNGTGGIIGLENESWRISASGRNADTVENQTTEADKREAFNLAMQEQAQVDAAEKARKQRKKSFWKSIVGMGAMVGLNYLTGGIGGNSSWGLASILGGKDTLVGRGVQEFQGAFGNGPRGEDQINILRGLFGMKKLEKQKAAGGLITSGSAGRDTTPVNAMQGEYIVSRNAARSAGTPFLDALNNNRVTFDNGTNQTSGPAGVDFSKLIDKIDDMVNVIKDAFESSAGNITVNVTENYNGSTQESQQGETNEDNQRLAQKIKEVVRSTILEEKRVGGMLNTTKV